MMPRSVPAIRGRLLTLIVVVTGAVAALFYWNHVPSCATDPRALRGEMMRGRDGRMLYFDGRCWSSTPLPPRDTPL